MFHIARLTHNYDNGWKKPSGPKYKSPDSESAFEAKYKFGFEEWFRCERNQSDGYQYAYIENLEAHHCDNQILLHTIRHNEVSERSDRKLVGVLRKGEHYTKWQDITTQMVAERFYSEMRIELIDALKLLPIEKRYEALHQFDTHKNADPKDGKTLFNVRYKIADFEYIIRRGLVSTSLTKNKRFKIETVTSDEIGKYPNAVQRLIAELGLD